MKAPTKQPLNDRPQLQNNSQTTTNNPHNSAFWDVETKAEHERTNSFVTDCVGISCNY